MATSPASDLQARLARLEKDVKDLRVRVAALERLVGAGELHPEDQSTVQQKVTYDWQK